MLDMDDANEAAISEAGRVSETGAAVVVGAFVVVGVVTGVVTGGGVVTGVVTGGGVVTGVVVGNGATVVNGAVVDAGAAVVVSPSTSVGETASGVEGEESHEVRASSRAAHVMDERIWVLIENIVPSVTRIARGGGVRNPLEEGWSGL